MLTMEQVAGWVKRWVDSFFLRKVGQQTYTGDLTINDTLRVRNVGLNVAPSSAAQLDVVASDAAVRGLRVKAAASPTAPLVDLDNHGLWHNGAMFSRGQAGVHIHAATNDSSQVLGNPRIAIVSLQLDYDGSNNTSESALINLYDSHYVTGQDVRHPTVLAAYTSYSSTINSQARRTIYTPANIVSNGAYVALTASTSVAVNTGYTYTTEILGNISGQIRVRCVRTGGATDVAKIHVHLIVCI